MLNDLTRFAAVPGAEQERFHQLFEAASYKFRQRFAAPTRARPSAAPGGSAPAAVAHGLPLDPPEGDCGLLDFEEHVASQILA